MCFFFENKVINNNKNNDQQNKYEKAQKGVQSLFGFIGFGFI